MGGSKRRRKRVVRTAAVVITCPPGEYQNTLRLAVDKIDLTSLEIEGMGAKKGNYWGTDFRNWRPQQS